MSKTVDMELKRAFAEHHQMMVETTQKLKLTDFQIESLKRSKQRAELTSVEIKNLTGDTKTYESVGRMFILTDIPVVLENLTQRSANCDEKIKSLENNKTYLEKTIKESENNIREMVQLRKDKPDK